MRTDVAASISAPTLTIRGLSSQPLRGRGIERVTLNVAPRTVTVLLGPPDSGKSALLRSIAGLDAPQEGSVELSGRDLSGMAPHRRGVGFVLQDPALFAHLTVADNIRFGLRVARWGSAERELRVAEVARVVGLGHRGEAHIEELAPAEQLGVAIARAIALAPRLLLLDEPLAGIAPSDRPRERATLRQLLQRLQLSVVLATSDVDDAMALATDVAVMTEGHVLQQGSVREVAARPQTAEVARTLGYVLLLEGRIEGERINELRVGAIPTPASAAHEGRVQVVAHPAALLAVPAGRGLGVGVSGTVAASQPLGSLWQVQVALGGRPPVLARWEWDDEPPAPGTAVDIATPTAGLLYFFKPSLTSTVQQPRMQLGLMNTPGLRELAETG